MNSNPILDANLACISNYNPDLKYKIMRVNSLKNDISFVNTVLQEPNLMYNGYYLHNNYGAEVEAREIFSNVSNNNLSMHVIYGFGLGYLFKEFALKSNGCVFLYEPDIEILAAVLEVVDFTNELSKQNVFIFNDFENFKKHYVSHYKLNSATSITFLPSYKKIFEQELSKFASDVNLLMGSVIINNNYIKSKMSPAVKMLCNNIDLLLNEVPLIEFKDLYKNQTAVIVSAGPSLDRDIEILKKYRNNAIIFAVGQACRTLIKNGITPDYISMIETNNQMSQIEGLDISNIDIILEPITYDGLHKANFHKVISYPSHTSAPNLIWTNYAHIDASPYFSSGTVSYTLLYSAKIFGFKNIILCGQDLAFLYGKCYASDARHTGLICEYDEKTDKVNISVEDFDAFANSFFDKGSKLTQEQKYNLAKIRLENIKNNLFFVNGINGKKLPTTNDYASFIIQFQNFASEFKEQINLYNTSLTGAKIDGFEDVSLEEILKDKPTVARNSLNVDFSYDTSVIISNITQEINTITEILKMLFTANSFLITHFDKEYQNRGVINENCIKYFKQILVMYIDLADIYCKKSRLFLCIHKAHSLELDARLQECSSATQESIQQVYKDLRNYVVSVDLDLKEIIEVLKLKVEKLNEMLNSKS